MNCVCWGECVYSYTLFFKSKYTITLNIPCNEKYQGFSVIHIQDSATNIKIHYLRYKNNTRSNNTASFDVGFGDNKTCMQVYRPSLSVQQIGE